MPYQALYRKYRPQRFDEVIGQAHITAILKNQVMDGHAAHAYLFAGTRGTGKTTTARIFARAVNCLSPGNGEPCGVCAACRVSSEVNADIVEMDAASNSGVEDIRSLLEKVRFTPLQLRTKVYIIDEAHALSSQAFNAMLKTLEEPPPHLIFILATTEPQKLPATIVSRCQRLDFHRLRIADMTALMRDILDKCNADIAPEGLTAIARAADGGMRDALSLADQCLSFCGSRISAADVYGVLGSMDSAFLFSMADALIDGDAPAALQLLEKVVRDGRDLSVFTHDLALHMRALLIAKLCGHACDILDCTEDAMRAYIAQAARCGEARLLQAMELLTRTHGELKYLALPRARIESALVRIAKPDEKESLAALAARVELLEMKLAQSAAAPGPDKACEQPPVPKKPKAVQTPTDKPPWEDTADVVPWEDADIPLPEVCPFGEEVEAAEAVEAPQIAATAGSKEAVWKTLLQKLQTEDISLWIVSQKGEPLRYEDGMLVIGFEQEIFCETFNRGRAKIEKLAGHGAQGVLKGKNSAEEQAKAVFGSMLEFVKD